MGPDVGGATWDRDGSQLAAGMERPAPDAGDIVGDRVGASAFAHRVLDERSLALVEQYPIHTAISGVVCIHRYRAQSGAGRERAVPNAGHAAGDRKAG